MTRLTTTMARDLNRMNEASRRMGGLGTFLLGGSPQPATGTLAPVAAVKYITFPALGTATYVHAAITLTAAAQDISTNITNPDYPRIVTIKGNAVGNAGNVVISGTNFADVAITETIALNGSTEVLGTKAFKTVTNIHVPAETHAGTDNCSIGVGDKIGFPVSIPNASAVLVKTFNGAVDSSTITASATLELSLAAPAGTFDGAKAYELTYLS